MSTDKRSVHTDALQTLGTIIDDTCKRDAIHLAVEPCIAGETLYPGMHIGIENGVATTKAAKKPGIVDPFISGLVPKDQMFWLIVYPRQITSLRHVWEHPDFAEPTSDNQVNKKYESEQWLRNFAETNDCPSYESMVGAVKASNGHLDDDSFFFGEDAHGSIPDEFWDHMEVVTGIKISQRPTYFSCSC
jgi:hypothetical protein